MSRRPAAALDAGAAAAIRDWLPLAARGADPVALAEVLPAARSAVAVTAPRHRDDAERMLRAVVPLLLWARRALGTVDAAAVLVPDVVEHWSMAVNAAQGRAWRQDARGVLTRVGRAANPRGWPKTRKQLGSTRVASPYDNCEEVSWRLAASRACKPACTDAAFMVVAAAGAGMSGPEIAAAEPGDIVDVGDGRLAVSVRGPNARLVPIRRQYTHLAEQAVAAAAGRRFVRSRDPNAVHRVAERLAAAGGRGLSLRRARSTFLAAHLQAGTPLAALRVIAGPVSMRTLDDLLTGAARDVDADTALQQGLEA